MEVQRNPKEESAHQVEGPSVTASGGDDPGENGTANFTPGQSGQAQGRRQGTSETVKLGREMDVDWTGC
jgi:hypothetical protein